MRSRILCENFLIYIPLFLFFYGLLPYLVTLLSSLSPFKSTVQVNREATLGNNLNQHDLDGLVHNAHIYDF